MQVEQVEILRNLNGIQRLGLLQALQQTKKILSLSISVSFRDRART